MPKFSPKLLLKNKEYFPGSKSHSKDVACWYPTYTLILTVLLQNKLENIQRLESFDYIINFIRFGRSYIVKSINTLVNTKNLQKNNYQINNDKPLSYSM